MKAKNLTKETISSIGFVEKNYPDFKIGDNIIIATKVKEGSKERIQNFQGDVIAIHNNGVSSSFTVRKIAANSIGVERIFPYFSPVIESIQLVKRGKVRRAKLYYLRKRVGRAARIKEDIVKKDTTVKATPVAKAEAAAQ